MSRHLNTTMSRGPVVDTGPLVNLLMLHYVRVAGIPEPRRNALLCKASNALFDKDDELQDLYYMYLRRYPRLNTTSHAIGEVCHLVARAIRDEEERSRFWDTAIEFLRGKQLDEHLITLFAVYDAPWSRKHAPLIGVADTGLVVLARTLGVDLLTEDGKTLIRSFSNEGVSCILVGEALRKRY